MLRILLSLLLVLPVLPAYAGAPQNDLFNDPSPYLAMHGNDPVNWKHWGSDAIEQAKKENKLLFVSIGYFSCHWCHVMQKESYQSGEIAYLLNKNFVSVKVDRELDPALDAKLIEFVDRTRGYSGWPLNVFITPEGYPLLGLVYLPQAEFKGLVTELDGLWQQDADALKTDAKAAAQELFPVVLSSEVSLQKGIAEIATDKYVSASMLNADQFLGGFGQQGKFPSVPQLMAMLNIEEKTPSDKTRAFLTTTLDNMRDLGLNDQLAGGFFRYTVDPQWRVPHFEKMLYDNALLASLYFRAAEVLKDQDYKRVALQTVQFMRDDMLTTNGALAASLSALDDKGIEGGGYLWQKDELQKLLDEKAYALVEEAWALKGGPTTEDGYLPMMTVPVDELAKSSGLSEQAVTDHMLIINKELLKARGKRTVPRDDKLLAAWNGLAISAFVEADKQEPRGKWLKTASLIRDYIVSTLWDEKTNTLLRARDAGGHAFGTVTLTDYVAVAEGLLDLSEHTGNKSDKKIAKQMIEQAWQRFVNEYGFRRTEKSLLALPEGEVILPDSPIYSPSSHLLKVTLRAFDKEHALHKRSLQMFASGQALMLEDPYWFATQVDVGVQNKQVLN